VWVDGYPNIAVAPVRPGPYVNTLYGWDWSQIVILIGNGGVFILYYLAWLNDSITEYRWWHHSYSSLMMLANLGKYPHTHAVTF
jgi:hypothetical protein